MRIIGCDLHSRQQTLAMLNVETGEVEECVVVHEGEIEYASSIGRCPVPCAWASKRPARCNGFWS